MYLLAILVSIVFLFVVDWRIALPILVIVFCLDRVIDGYRRELERKIKRN